MRIEVALTPENCPELSPDDVEEGENAKVSFVYVEPGRKVRKGEELMELVGRKAAFNVVAPAEGVVEEILVSEDDEVEQGRVVVVLEG